MNKQEFKFKNKKILIYGFGISGKATFNYLINKNYVYLYDDNSRPCLLYTSPSPRD